MDFRGAVPGSGLGAGARLYLSVTCDTLLMDTDSRISAPLNNAVLDLVSEFVAEIDARHIETDGCGFDRDSSHSLGTYVCDCGWVDGGPPETDTGTDQDLAKNE